MLPTLVLTLPKLVVVFDSVLDTVDKLESVVAREELTLTRLLLIRV